VGVMNDGWKTLRRTLLIAGFLAALSPVSGIGQEPEPVVHAVLFYSPTCPHCHDVITNFLIPLQNEYGSRLVIIGLDTTQPWANELFWEALRFYEVPEDQWAVPFMIVDDQILVGGDEIPSRFRTILDEGLAAGGIDLPDLPALMTFMKEQDLLDERYPDRRIAKQAPPQEESGGAKEETGAAQGQEESGGEALPESDSGSGMGADTVSREAPSGGEEPTADTSSAPETTGPDTDRTMEGDTLAATPSDEGAVGRGGPEPSDETEAVPGSMPTDSAGAGGGAPEPGSGGGATAVREGEGSLGLQDAATRLESMTAWDRFSQDPVGNSLAVLVLLGMLISLAVTGFPGRVRRSSWPAWTVPILVVAGMGVAAYLSFVEVSQVQAVCGPVGDCNTVNQSEYARLFGFLPVGILGLAGYALLLVFWVLGRWGSESLRVPGRMGLWAGALFGVLFSIYLTFLEPFVIGATCAWCLTSAVVMTLLLWAAAPEAAAVWPGGGGEGVERSA